MRMSKLEIKDGKNNSIGGGVKKKTPASAVAAAIKLAKQEIEGNDEDDDDDDKDEESKQLNEMNERDGSRSRKVIQFLIEKYPLALITDNNFMATPVETVLEKSRRIKSLSRKISIYGLYDDPPTARLLLVSHKYRSEKRVLPPLRPRFNVILKELNWLARRDGVLLSCIGEKRTKGNTDNDGKIRTTVGGSSSSVLKTKLKNKADSKQANKEKEKDKDKKGKIDGDLDGRNVNDNNSNSSSSNIIVLNGDEDIPRNNILARFRRRGYMDIVRTIISWI